MAKPIFRDLGTWERAELLMQPAFIRVIDNIRKQLDESTWKGTYQEVQVWPEGTSDAVKARVMDLGQQLANTPPEEAGELEQELSGLPLPYPAYHLHLEQGEQRYTVDLWELCYQVCFSHYTTGQQEPVEVDLSLFDEMEEVDWNTLELKTKQLVEQVFTSLPGSSADPRQ
ncbi:MAG: hypothetical protein SFW36_01000 [Leptolyngbyaceae cyanobacterium bins.59]|nr:hypothetical protein [Leptolyngbyaceae cyanobacterium bins.59]